MPRSLALVMVLVALSLLTLVGCGGGGAGGAVAPPIAPVATEQVYILDFVHNTVTTAVQPQFVERKPGQPGADLKVTLAIKLTDPGRLGRRLVNATVKNNTPALVGANDLGTVTGVDVCFTSTIFKNAGGAVVPGGGYWGYDSLNPLDGTPIYHLTQSLAIGASKTKLVEFILPPNVVTAVVTIIVRADTAIGNPPDLARWYLTTVAGNSGIQGYRDGPAGLALFSTALGLVFREDQGDLLIADFANSRVRRLYQGQVSTFAGNGDTSVCNTPYGVAQDSEGNVLISESFGYCVSLTPSSGGAPTAIAGLRGTSGNVVNASGSTARFNLLRGLAVAGNAVYVCDPGVSQVKLLTYIGSGSRFDPANWYVTDDTNGAAFSVPDAVAVDGLGNVYVVDFVGCRLWVQPGGSGPWTIIAGSGANATTDGTGLSADFHAPSGLAVDQAGILYVAESSGALRRVRHTSGSLTDPTTWVVETLAPNNALVPVDGFRGTGQVHDLRGVTCTRAGVLYLTEVSDLRRLDRTRN